LASLTAAFPNVHFRVSIADTDTLVERMLKGAVDLAVINPVPDDRLFYRHLLIEDLVLIGGPRSDLSPTHAVAFSELVKLPLVMPAAPTGIRNTLENAALRLKVAITSRLSTDSMQVTKELVESGLGYAVMPLAACTSEVEAGRLHYAPIREPELTHQLGVAATAQLEPPREFAAKVGILIREEVERLTASGVWPAHFVPSPSWDPNIPEAQTH